jgi:hypothetical protein
MRENFRIEGEQDHVVLVLPRRCDTWITSWQDADQLGLVLERAAMETPVRPLVDDPVRLNQESSQIRLNTHKGNVALIFDWTDRIKLSPGAAILVARAIRVMAQDCRLAERGTHMDYKAKGRKGRPTPWWDGSRLPKLFGGLRK